MTAYLSRSLTFLDALLWSGYAIPRTLISGRFWRILSCFLLLLRPAQSLDNAPNWHTRSVCRNISYTVVLSAARIRQSRNERKSKDPEDVSPAMLIQGVLLRDCPPESISRLQFSAKPCQRGFIFSISTTFFLPTPAVWMYFASPYRSGSACEIIVGLPEASKECGTGTLACAGGQRQQADLLEYRLAGIDTAIAVWSGAT
jgi:hypothetical protein